MFARLSCVWRVRSAAVGRRGGEAGVGVPGGDAHAQRGAAGLQGSPVKNQSDTLEKIRADDRNRIFAHNTLIHGVSPSVLLSSLEWSDTI